MKKSVGDSPKGGGGERVPNTWEGDGSKRGRGKHHRSVSPPHSVSPLKNKNVVRR